MSLVDVPSRQQLFRAATVLIPLAAVVVAWNVFDLGSYRTPQDVARALNGVADRPFGWALVPLGFALGSVLFIPVNALIAGVTLTFDPLRGFIWSMAGGLLGSVVTYFVGVLFGAGVVELLRGPRVDPVLDTLRRNPFRTSLILHLVPIGNFTVVNLLAGALRVPFGGFLLGTALGLLPGVVFFTFLAGQLPRLFRGPTPLNVALLVVGLLLAVGVGLLIRRWAKRAQRERVAT